MGELKKDNQKLGVGVVEKNKNETRKPRQYKVILHNDDYTPVEFVVDLLQTVFRKNKDEATSLTMQVHKTGSAIAGAYTYEVAETKTAQVHLLARLQEHPLMATFEPEE